MPVSPPLRLAAIDFLNAAPLMWGLDRDPRFALRPMLPSACADALAADAADLGVIPAIEWARQPETIGLGGLGVAASRQVRSILLIARRPAREVRSVALDAASRTSSVLAQLLLRRRFGASCRAIASGAGWEAGLEAADAVLVIGDPALRLSVERTPQKAGCHVYDLATEWHAWTGLPFVFAVWGIRPEVWQRERGWLFERLRQARVDGAKAQPRIVAAWSRRLELPAEEIAAYLNQDVEHDLGAEHHRGLRKFLALAVEDGLAPARVGERNLAEVAA